MPEEQRIVFLRSNPIAPDPRVEKAAKTLANAGYAVQIVGWDRSGSLAEFDTLHRLPLHRLRIQADYGTGLHNFPALLRWQSALFRWLIKHRLEFDIIHACDFDTVIPALLMKWLWGKKVIYDIFDFYADHLRATPSWLKGWIRGIDRLCIGRADGVILVDEVRREQIKGSHPKRVVVIYNTPQDVLKSLSSSSDINQKSYYHIAYVGLLQVERGIFEILDVLQKHPDWTLSLAGFGGDEARIKNRALKMENVNWYGRVGYDRALELSFQADVLFATYDPSIQNHRYASPNKLFEAMMLGKPILVARNTNIDRIVEEENCGIIVEFGDIAQIEHALVSLSEDPQKRSLLGKNARKAYIEKFSWSVMESRLIELYASIQR